MARISLSRKLKERLFQLGVETLFQPDQVGYPAEVTLEAPCSLKWMRIEHSLKLGAFSYAVSGFFFAVDIGRYTSIGEQVSVGRQDHPTTWLSTSPFQYLNHKLFELGQGFEGAQEFHGFKSHLVGKVPGTKLKRTKIGNDVWIGHGAYVRAGVTIGDGAIVAAHSVVAKDVPPYALVAGNPAQVKRYRFDPETIAKLLALQWWRFAPWQLQGLPFHQPAELLPQLTSKAAEWKPFQPKPIKIGDLAK
jgi:acetyltransferase-like isoleucine patch superfamily enzyme